MKPPSSNIPTPLMLCLGRPGRLVISACMSVLGKIGGRKKPEGKLKNKNVLELIGFYISYLKLSFYAPQSFLKW